MASQQLTLTQLSSDLGDMRNLPPRERNFLTQSLSNVELFPPLRKPGKSDWLRSHFEPKQSVKTWNTRLGTYVPATRRRNKTIYLVPLGNKWTESEVEVSKSGKTEKFLSLLQRFATSFFLGCDVKVKKPVSVEKMNCQTRINSQSGKPQLFIPDIVTYLKSKLPHDAFCIVGVTMIDLFPDESWNFVFGQAHPTKAVGVFSFARYNPAFYEDEPSAMASPTTSTLVLWRSCKVMTHEIAHLFFLGHCVYFSCGMNGSNHLEEAEKRPLFMCPICLHKLKLCIVFGLRERYHAMLDFCREVDLDVNFTKCCQWLEKTLETIDSM